MSKIASRTSESMSALEHLVISHNQDKEGDMPNIFTMGFALSRAAQLTCVAVLQIAGDGEKNLKFKICSTAG